MNRLAPSGPSVCFRLATDAAVVAAVHPGVAVDVAVAPPLTLDDVDDEEEDSEEVDEEVKLFGIEEAVRVPATLVVILGMTDSGT